MILLATTNYIWANPDSEIAIVQHSFIKSASFIIENDGGTYKAFDGQTGELAHSGNNFVTVTQSAIDALTSGRTWQEKMVFKGDITIDSNMMNDLPIQIPSYTELDFGQCRITYSGSNKSKNILENSDRTNGDSHIIVRGGFFDGQRGSTSYRDAEGADYQSVGDAILWQKVTDSRIEDVNITSFAGNALALHTGRRNRYEDVISRDCGGYGQVEMTNEVNSTFVRCDASHSNDANGQGADGFDWCTSTEYCWFISCIANNNSYWGFGDGGESSDLFFFDCVARYNTEDGFVLVSDSQLVNAYSTNNGAYGVWINGKRRITIIGGTFSDNADYGIYLKNSDNSTIIGARFKDNTNGAIDFVESSENLGIINCQGFATENSATESNCVNGTYVSHGLAGTPDVVTLTISGSNYLNSSCFLLAPTVIATNSTHFQIGLYINNNATITAVTTTDKRDISWYAEYVP